MPPSAFLHPFPVIRPHPHTRTTCTPRRPCATHDTPDTHPQHIPATPPHAPYTPPTSFTYETDTSLEPPPPGAPPPPSTPGRPDRPDDSDLPADIRLALSTGSLPPERIPLYRSWLRNPILALLLSLPAFRSRALASPDFMFKLLAQELIGNGTALASEIAVRGKEIVHELEYVASDLIVGTVVEAAFVWLLAPTLRGGGGGGGLSELVKRLPAHVFEVGEFGLSARVASFVYAGLQYAAIGFVAGVVGTGITYALIEGRKRLDSTYVPERPLPDVLPNSAGWAAFMALSSNPRFQAVEGLELLAGRMLPKRAVNSAIVVLRFVNNYWGGVQFVQFFRYLGLHATGEDGKGEREDKGEGEGVGVVKVM